MARADETLFLWINGLAGHLPPLDRLMVVVAGDYLVPVSMALVLLGTWFAGRDVEARQRYQVGVMVSLMAMGLSSLAVLIVSELHFRPRPFVDLEVELLLYRPTELSSFPSNAAAVTFGIATAVLGVNRRLAMVLLAAAGVYAISRVFVGVHYPLDVLAGGAIGVVMALLSLAVRPIVRPPMALAVKAARILCLA